MLNQKDHGTLLLIEKHCNRILSKIQNLDFETFEADDDLKEIVCFNLLQIGELAKNLSDDFIKNHAKVPWKQIKGLRDKVAHGYGTLNLDLIYNTSKEEIPELLDYCQTILNDALDE